MKKYIGLSIIILSLFQPVFASTSQAFEALKEGEFSEAFSISSDAAQGEFEYKMGKVYEYGQYFFDKDIMKAKEWYEKSASRGNASANLKLGLLYYNGEELEADLDKAEFYFLRAAHNSTAQLGLGLTYLTQKKYALSNKWLKKACENGEEQACTSVNKSKAGNALEKLIK